MQMIFDLTAKKLISYDQESSEENLRQNFVAFIRGLISFPLDIPGTAYHKCLQVILNPLDQCGRLEIFYIDMENKYGFLLLVLNSCKLFSG